MQCPQCGAVVSSSDAKYCMQCGHALDATRQAATASDFAAPAPSVQQVTPITKDDIKTPIDMPRSPAAPARLSQWPQNAPQPYPPGPYAPAAHMYGPGAYGAQPWQTGYPPPLPQPWPPEPVRKASKGPMLLGCLVVLLVIGGVVAAVVVERQNREAKAVVLLEEAKQAASNEHYSVALGKCRDLLDRYRGTAAAREANRLESEWFEAYERATSAIDDELQRAREEVENGEYERAREIVDAVRERDLDPEFVHRADRALDAIEWATRGADLLAAARELAMALDFLEAEAVLSDIEKHTYAHVDAIAELRARIHQTGLKRDAIVRARESAAQEDWLGVIAVLNEARWGFPIPEAVDLRTHAFEQLRGEPDRAQLQPATVQALTAAIGEIQAAIDVTVTGAAAGSRRGVELREQLWEMAYAFWSGLGLSVHDDRVEAAPEPSAIEPLLRIAIGIDTAGIAEDYMGYGRLYTGASVGGSVTASVYDEEAHRGDFYGYSEPPFSISFAIGEYSSASAAPFGVALRSGGADSAICEIMDHSIAAARVLFGIEVADALLVFAMAPDASVEAVVHAAAWQRLAEASPNRVVQFVDWRFEHLVESSQLSALIQCLGQVGTSEAVALLGRFRSRSGKWIRQDIVSALEAAGGEPAKALLRRIARDDDDADVRRSAENVLSQMD